MEVLTSTMIIADGLTPVGSGLFVAGEFHLQTLLSLLPFSIFVTGTNGGYLEFTRYLLPGRFVISQIVGNGILFGGARNSAGDP